MSHAYAENTMTVKALGVHSLKSRTLPIISIACQGLILCMSQDKQPVGNMKRTSMLAGNLFWFGYFENIDK